MGSIIKEPPSVCRRWKLAAASSVVPTTSLYYPQQFIPEMIMERHMQKNAPFAGQFHSSPFCGFLLRKEMIIRRRWPQNTRQSARFINSSSAGQWKVVTEEEGEVSFSMLKLHAVNCILCQSPKKKPSISLVAFLSEFFYNHHSQRIEEEEERLMLVHHNRNMCSCNVQTLYPFTTSKNGNPVKSRIAN